MPDKRELILDRIFTVLKTVSGITTFARNEGQQDNDARPAIVLCDGDENARLTPPPRGRGGLMAPTTNTMRPEIYILLKEGRVKNVDVGSNLNAFRLAVSQAIAQDAELAALIGPNGSIVYNGCVTDLKSGSALSGQMRLDFAFTYVFDPT